MATCSVSIAPAGNNNHRRHSTKCSWLEWPCRRKSDSLSNTITPFELSTKNKNDLNSSCEPTSISVHNRLTCQSQSQQLHQEHRCTNNNSKRLRRRNRRMPRFNSVSKIDIASRIFFPLVFFLINVFYWCSYLTKSERLTTTSMLRQ